MRSFKRFTLAAVASAVLFNPAHAQPIPPNYNITPGFPGLQNEEQIFLCRTDTTRVLINHRDFRLGYRQIGLGQGVNLFPEAGIWTFTDTLIHPFYQVYERQSDPVMTVNSAGALIISHLDYQDIPAYDSSHIAFMVSEDCGDTWGGPYTVSDTIGPYFEDKQFITSDRTGGLHDGNVYLSWTRFPDDDPTTLIMFARSTTGAVTWDAPIAVGPPFYVTCADWTVYAGQFSQPLVGKDGAVYVFWQGWDVDSLNGNCNFYTAIQVNKSTDGGVTWQGPRTIGRVDGWSMVDGGVNVYSQPTTAADLSDGPHGGNLYLQYRDTTSAPLYESDILFRRSLDTGMTWSVPMRVNDDPVGPDIDQFHNWLVVNDEGTLVSIWYDQRDFPVSKSFHVYAAYSFDGGETWTSNHRISEDPINPADLAPSAPAERAVQSRSPFAALAPQAPQAGLIAEYIGVDCVGDKVVATWTGTSWGWSGGTAQDVFFANWYLEPMIPRLIGPIGGETVQCDDPSLRWATSWKEDEDRYRLQVALDPDFVSVVQDVVLDSTAWHGSLLDGETMYYWRVRVWDTPSGYFTSFSAADSFYAIGCSACVCPFQGDLDASGFINAVDLTLAINVVFFGQPGTKDPACATTRADFNCDGLPNAVDLALVINHVFFGGAGPCDPCL